ncbi:MAG TPA: TolC family protein, partial [Flavobacteriales bacterium]|nr:TolC family protein [Flavobacteriales bacterium]
MHPLTLALSLSAQPPLDNYIAQGLANNVVLQQKHIALDRAMQDLKEAKSLFLPSVNLNASYLSGEGGRYFDFPVGDLVNPVYTTLNQFIGQERFPQVDNVQAYLNPNNYYDAHVRASMPLLNTDIIHNRRIQQHAVQLQEYEVDIYRRELVKDIKVAYYNVLMAAQAVRSYTSALQLLERNVEVTRSLHRHGSGVPAQVLRAQAEQEQITAQLAQATNQYANAERYFNFLLNTDLDAPVDESLDVNAALGDTARTMAADISRREELQALRTAVGLRDSQTKLTSNYWVPKLSTFVDLGYQGLDWSTDRYADYYLFGVQLDVPLFNGGRNRFKQHRARSDRDFAELTERNSTQQLLLGAMQAR